MSELVVSNEQIVARALVLAKGMPRVQIEVPVNPCANDDPPGESPSKLVWVEDMSATARVVIEALEAAGRLVPGDPERAGVFELMGLTSPGFPEVFRDR